MSSNLKFIISYLLIMCAGVVSANNTVISDVEVNNLELLRQGDFLQVKMDINLSNVRVPNNKAMLILPMLVNDTDTLPLQRIGIYSRQRYYYYHRNNGGSILSDNKELIYQTSDHPNQINYDINIPYQSWMDGSQLMIRRSIYGCCKKLKETSDTNVGNPYFDLRYPELSEMVMAFVSERGNPEKTDTVIGAAFIDFPVNKTYIKEDYHNNAAELAKIWSSIDSVRNDKDITITEVELKGYASPEGSYTNNTNLAIGRTDALKKHIQNLYKFGKGVISTAYEPEDWEGLRQFVNQSNLDHRSEILEIIDTDIDPDKKEELIKRRFPEEYAFLKEAVYPSLRHTDYRIAYTIRRFSDIDEIRQLVKTNPRKLSMNEFLLAAQSYPVGSDEYNEVFETAVRIHPTSEEANINAASAALSRGDVKLAAQFISKMGNSPEAIYTKGVYKLLNGELDEARSLLEEAQLSGVDQSEIALKNLEMIEEYNRKASLSGIPDILPPFTVNSKSDK